MNKREENINTMLNAVVGVIKSNPSIVGKVNMLKTISDDFVNSVEKIKQINTNYLNVSNGVIAKKHAIADELIDETSDLASALKIYGIKNKLYDLKEKAAVTVSSLSAMRDTDLASKAKDIAQELIKIKTLLPNYGILSTRVDKYSTLADSYEKAIQEAEAITADKEAARKELTEAFDAASEILNEQLDAMMEVISKDEPDLYNQYKEARPIKNLGLRKEKEEEEPTA